MKYPAAAARISPKLSSLGRSTLLFAFGLLLLSFAGHSSSSQANDGLLGRTSAELNRVWGGLAGCADPALDAKVDAFEGSSVPTSARRDYTACSEQALRSMSGRLLLNTIEDALTQGGVALFDDGFRVDSQLSWVFGEDIQGEIDAVLPVWSNRRAGVFFQPGLIFWPGIEGQERIDGNLGLVYRRFIDAETVAGGSVFYDHDFSRGHSRAGFGLDLQSGIIHAGANYYHPLTDWLEGRDGYEELAQRGADLRVGLVLERVHLDGSVGYWRFEGERNESGSWAASYEFDAGYRVLPGVFVEGGYSRHDPEKSLGARWNAGLAFQFALPGLEGASGSGGGGLATANLWSVVDREKRILYEERVGITPAVLSLRDAAAVTVEEGDTTVVTWNFAAPLERAATLNLEVGGTADSDDYNLSTRVVVPSPGTSVSGSGAGEIALPVGATSVEATVGIRQETVREEEETLLLTLGVASADALHVRIAQPRVEITIPTNDQYVVQWADATSRVSEGTLAHELAIVLGRPAPTGGLSLQITSGDVDDARVVTPVDGELDIPAGETRVPNVVVRVLADSIAEPREVVDFTLTDRSGSLPSEWCIGNAPNCQTQNPKQHVHELVIPANENDVSFAASSDDEFNEAGGTAQVVVRVEEAAPSDITLSVAPGGTATRGSDYTLASDSLTIPAGATTSEPIRLTGIEDPDAEGNEMVMLTLAATSIPDGWTLGTSTHSLTLIDNDNAIGFATAGGRLGEGDSLPLRIIANPPPPPGTASFTLTVTIPSESSSELSFHPTNSLLTRTVTFRAGTRDESLTVYAFDDAIAEGDETVELTLTGSTGASGYTIGQTTFDATIVANGNIVEFDAAASDDSFLENGGTADVLVSVKEPAPEDISLVVSAQGAQLNTDFTYSPSTLVIPAGESSGTITLTGIDNSGSGGNKTITLSIAASTSLPDGWRLGRTADDRSYDVTLIDDDGSVGFAVGGSRIGEGNPHSLDIIANPPVTGAGFTLTATLPAALKDDVSFNQTPAGDATDLTTTVTFSTGDQRQQLTLYILADTVSEPDEIVDVTLTLPDGTGYNAGRLVHQVTIPGSDNTISFVNAASTATEGQGIPHRIPVQIVGPYTLSRMVISVSREIETGTEGPGEITNAGSLVIPAGAGRMDLRVGLPDDNIHSEGDEVFVFTLSPHINNRLPNGWAIGGTTTHRLTVKDDDQAVGFAENSPRVFTGEGSNLSLDIVASPALSAGTNFTLTATLSGDHTSDFYFDNSGTQELTTTLSFAATDATKPLVVYARDDNDPERDETVTITLTSTDAVAAGYNIVPFTHVLTLPANDNTLFFENAASDIDEMGSGNSGDVVLNILQPFAGEQRVTVLRSGSASSSDVTIAVAATDAASAAVSGARYNNDVLTIPAEARQVTFTLTSRDDPDRDPLERVTFTLDDSVLTLPDGWSIDTTKMVHTVTIEDDEDAPVGFESSNPDVVAEGENIELVIEANPLLASDSVGFTLTATISGTHAADFSFADGSVVSSMDVAFAAGEFEKTLTLYAVTDTDAEIDETAEITLSSSDAATAGYTLDVTPHVFTIPANDNMLSFNASSGTGIDEATTGTTTTTVVIDISQPFPEETEVVVDLGGSLARLGDGTSGDYAITVAASDGATAVTGASYADHILTVPAGADTVTFTLTSTDDSDVDPVETIVLTLKDDGLPSGWSVDTTMPAKHIHTVTINDDEAQGIGFSAIASDIAEGGSGTLTIEMTRALTGAQTVELTVDIPSSGALSFADTSSGAQEQLRETVTFAASETSKDLTVYATDDATAEVDQLVAITLTADPDDLAALRADGVFYALVAARSTHTVTIPANDNLVSLAPVSPATALPTTVSEAAGSNTLQVGVNIAQPFLINTSPTMAEVRLELTGTATYMEDYTISASSPASASYDPASGILSLPNDVDVGTVILDITVMADTEVESGETIILTLANDGLRPGWSVDTTAATHTITIHNDADPTTIGFETSPLTGQVNEGQEISLRIGVGEHRNALNSQDVVLMVSAQYPGDPTATPPVPATDASAEVTFSTQTLTFNETATDDQDITVTVNSDSIAEPAEQVNIVLAIAPSSSLTTTATTWAISPDSYEINIAPSDHTISFNQEAGTFTEGGENGNGTDLVVQLSGAPPDGFTVGLTVSDTSTASPDDYAIRVDGSDSFNGVTYQAGILTIPSLLTTATLEVVALGDLDSPEVDETLTLTLSDLGLPAGWSVAHDPANGMYASYTMTIEDVLPQPVGWAPGLASVIAEDDLSTSFYNLVRLNVVATPALPAGTTSSFSLRGIIPPEHDADLAFAELGTLVDQNALNPDEVAPADVVGLASTGSASFNAGQGERSLWLYAYQDNTPERSETIEIELVPDTARHTEFLRRGGYEITPSTYTITIPAHDNSVAFATARSDTEVLEARDAIPAEVVLEIDRPFEVATSLVMRIEGTALEAADYTFAISEPTTGATYDAPNNVLSIDKDIDRVVFEVHALNDAATEIDETVLFTLAEPVGGLPNGWTLDLAASTHEVVVRDDDDFSVGFTNASLSQNVVEGEGLDLRIAVNDESRLTATPIRLEVVALDPVDDSLSRASEVTFSPNASNVTFSNALPGQKTVSVTANIDAIAEGLEEIDLVLRDGTTQNRFETVVGTTTWKITPSTFRLNIGASNATMRFSPTASTYTEGFGRVFLTMAFDPPLRPGEQIPVDFALTGPLVSLDPDPNREGNQLVTASRMIDAGTPGIEITILDDGIDTSATQTAVVTMSVAADASRQLAGGTHTITITDNDTVAAGSENQIGFAPNLPTQVLEDTSIYLPLRVTSAIPAGASLTFMLGGSGPGITRLSGTPAVTFGAGETLDGIVRIQAPENSATTGDEMATITLTLPASQLPTGWTVVGATANASGDWVLSHDIMVIDNEGKERIGFALPRSRPVAEGAGQIFLPLELTGTAALPTGGIPLTVSVSGASGLVTPTSPITITSRGNQAARIPLTILSDGIDSGNRRATITIAAGTNFPTGWQIGGNNSFALTIQDDDSGNAADRLGWAQPSITIVEGDTAFVEVELTSAVPTGGAFTNNFAEVADTNNRLTASVVNGVGTALVYAVGDSTNRLVRLTANENEDNDGTEDIVLRLGTSLPSGWSHSQQDLTVRIVDNDVRPNNIRFSAPSTTANEGAGAMGVMLTLTSPAPASGLLLAVSSDNDMVGLPASGHLYIPAAAESIELPIVIRDNGINETAASQQVMITIAPGPGFPSDEWGVPNTDSTHMVTITDDETGARANRVRWAANFDNAGNTVNHSLTVDEGGSITVNVEVTSVVGGTDLTLPLSFWTATTAAQAGSEASSFEPSEVVFPAGSQAAQQVTITVPEDDVVNGARTVALLIDPAYSQGGFQAASGNILQIPINDNDTAKTIELTAPVTATVDEGHGEFLLNLTASHTLPEEGLVLGADANNALVRLKDPITGSSTVRVYNDKAFIPFEVLDDGIDQSGDASVTLTLSGGGLPSDWALGTATSFTLTVTDDDDGATAERVGWAQSSITIAEGSSVQVPLRVTTAVPSGASDFTLRTNPSGIRVEIVGDETISFSANDELSKMVTITAVDNAVIEGDQTVTVSLTLETGSSLPTDWQIAETTLTVTITDNDVAGGTIGFDPNLNLRFTEEPNIDSDGNEIAFVRVPISLTNANGGPGIVPSGGLPLLVTFTESDGNEDADARLFAPPVRIPENAGVYGRYDLLLRIVDDNVPEPDETVTITIAADSGFPFSDWSIPGETNSLNFIIPANDSTGTFRLAPVNQPFDETLANGNVLTHQGVNDSARSLHERERLLMTFSAPTPQGLVIKAEATEAGSGNVTTPGGPMRLVQADGTLGMSRDFPIPAGVTHYWFPISNMATGRGRITLTNESKSQALKDNWTDERNASDQSFGYITFTVSNSEISIAGNSASRVAEGTNRAIYLTFDRPVPEGAGFDLLAFIPAINNGDMAHSNAQDQRGTISPTSTSSLYQTGIGQTTGGINGCNPNGNNCVLITVPEGSRGAEILFSAAQDDTPEADESVNVTFQLRSGESLPTGWQFSGGGRQLIHTVTIPYNDIRVSHESLNVFTAKEGEEPAAVIRIDAPLHDPGSGNRLLDPSIVPTDGISLLVTTTLPEDVRLQLAGESGAGTLTSDKTITLTSSSSTGNVTFFGTQIKVVPVDDNLEEGNEVGELIISEDPDNPLPNGWRITNARRDLVVTDGASQTNGVIRFDTLQTDFEKVLETDPVPPQRSQENKTWRITERGTDYSRELTLRTTEQASASYTVTATIKEPDGDDAADVTAGSVTVATTVGVGDEIKLPITIEADSIREGVEVVEISLASSNLPSGWAIDSERGTIYLQIWDNLVYFESLLQIVEPGDLLNLRISMPPATADTTLSAIVSPSGSGIVSVGAVSFGIGKTEATVPVQISETGIPNAGVDVDIFLTGTLPEGVKFAANSSAQNPSGTFTRLRLEPRNNVIAFADTKSSTVDTAGTLPSRLQLVYPEAPGLWVSSAGENTVQVPTDLIVDEYGIHRPAEGAKPTGTIKIHVRSNNPFVTLDNDATPEETVVSLVAGTTSTSIPVTIPDDFIAGLDKSLVEVVRFTMTPAEELPIGWLLSQHDVHEMTITNNVAPTVHFAEDFVSVREDVGFHPIEISLTDPAPANGLTLQLTSENNARVSVPDNGVVSFAAGETSKSVTLTIVDNDGDEILGAARGNLVGLTLTGDLPSGWEYYQPPGSDQLVSLVVTVGAPTRTVLTAADPNETSMLLHILEDDKVIRFAANLPTRMIEGGSAQTITLIASEAPTSNIALDATTMVHSNSGRTIQLTPANAVISAGSTTATFTISAQEHSSITNPEQVSVLISPDAGGAPGITGLPEGWIFEPSQTDSSGNLAHLMWAEDNDGETVGFASTSTSETFEGATNAVLNLELSAAAPDGTRYARSVVNQFGARIVTKGALVFTVRSSDYSNAHPRDDFVVVPHGDTTFAIPLRIPVDQRVENEAQDVTFTLIPNAGYELKDNGTPNDPSDDVWESLWPAGWRVAPQTHTVRILPDNTPAIYFTGNRTKHLVLERFSDEQGALALQIGLSVPAPKNFNVVLTTTERDRDPYADVSLPSVIPVPEGARSVEVPVTIINDILVEAANETVDIAIDASRLPRGWRLGRESHRIVLLPSDERNRQNVEFSSVQGRLESAHKADFAINVGQPDATPPFDVIIRNEDPEFFGWTDPVTGAITDRMTVRVTLPRVVPPPAVGTATLTIPWAGDTDSDAENYKIYMEAGANFPSSRRLGGRNITELRIITDDVTVPVPLTPVAPPPVSGTATLTFRGLPFTVPSKTEADGATAFVSADLTAAAPTGGLPLNMTITRKDGSTDPITNDIASVSVASSGSSQGQTTLTYGGDVADGNFTIPAGDTNFIATLTLANDNVAESDEIFIITFTQGSNFPTSWGSIPAGGITHEFTINDDDSAVGTNTAGFFTASGSGTEGASRSPGVVLDFTAAPPSGGLPLKLTITREDTTNTDAISTDITGVSVSGRGTITYTGTPASGSFTVPATDQSVRVTFDLADDNVAESSEVFVITLEAGDNFPTSWGSVPAGTTHKLTINDDDAPTRGTATLDISANGTDASATEGTGAQANILLRPSAAVPGSGLPLNMTITRKDGSTDPITNDIASIQLSGISTLPNPTGTVANSSFTIPDGFATVLVTFVLVNDTTVESAEEFIITFTEGTGFPISWGSVPANTSHELTINDDDGP